MPFRKRTPSKMVNVSVEAGVLRRRLGLTEDELPDDPTMEQVAAAFQGSPEATAGFRVPPGMVLVDEQAWNEVQAAGPQLAAQAVARHDLIEGAIQAGKIPPSRREHYQTLYDQDPDDTAEIIAAMPADSIPVDAKSSGQDASAVEASYPDRWLPEVHDDRYRRVVAAHD